MYRRAPLYYLLHCHCNWLNHTTWSNRNCRTQHGDTQVGKHTAAPPPPPWNFRKYCFIFYTIQVSVCCVGCLMIANKCTYISLYIRNTAISVNKQLVCISPHQFVNTCDLHLIKSLSYHVVNCSCILRHFEQ